jgi:hypothetical protein
MGNHFDIFYIVNIVAKFAFCPHKNHYVAVKRIFEYLARTFNLVLCYNGNTYSNLIEAYLDANCAGDITNIKSRTGSLFLLNYDLVT